MNNYDKLQKLIEARWAYEAALSALLAEVAAATSDNYTPFKTPQPAFDPLGKPAIILGFKKPKAVVLQVCDGTQTEAACSLLSLMTQEAVVRAVIQACDPTADRCPK